MAEENNSQNNPQNPSNIWQGIWAKLFIQIMQEMTNQQFQQAYKTMQLLKTQLPPECEKDVKTNYKKLDEIFQIEVNYYFSNKAQRDVNNYYKTKGYNEIIDCLTSVKNSLYDRKWITKNFGFSGVDPNNESTTM